VIEAEKLVDYALNPENPIGRHKALVFERALGIERADWEHLRDEILRQLPGCPVSGNRPALREGERLTWEVLVPISGLRRQKGRQLLVITGWELIDGLPRLVTTLVAPRNRQDAGGGAYNPSP
jgi:hypothetical protein